jgi:amino acid transporter
MNTPAPTAALKREMTGFGGLLITLSCLSPSIGVFIVGSDLLHQVGSGVFLCFLAAVILGIAMSAVYAELGSAFPHTGGEYTIAGTVLGREAGFAMLATNLIGYSIALALSALGIADYLRPLIPEAPTVSTALVTIVAVSLIGLLSVKLNARVTGAFLALEILALAVLTLLGFAHPHGGAVPLILHPMMAEGAGGLKAAPLGALGVAAAAGIYAFNGYGAVIFLGEEIRNARRKIGRVVYWALGIAAVTELLPMLAIIVGAPDFAALAASPDPIPEFMRRTGGAMVAKLLSLAVAIAIFNAMIAIALCGSRQIYASARDRCWPEAISRRLDRVHPRFGSPWMANLTLGAAGLACCFVPLNLLVIVIANGNVAIYATLCIAVIVGRRSGATGRSQARMRLFPLAPVFVLLALAGVVWADLLDPETGGVGLGVTVAILAMGVAYYHFALRRSGAWRPLVAIDEDLAMDAAQ